MPLQDTRQYPCSVCLIFARLYFLYLLVFDLDRADPAAGRAPRDHRVHVLLARWEAAASAATAGDGRGRPETRGPVDHRLTAEALWKWSFSALCTATSRHRQRGAERLCCRTWTRRRPVSSGSAPSGPSPSVPAYSVPAYSGPAPSNPAPGASTPSAPALRENHLLALCP